MNESAEVPGAPWRDESFETRFTRSEFCAGIKRNAVDFMVRERLGFAPVGSGEHVYLDLTKVHANTVWVARQIANFAEVKQLDVGFAGRKDRHAIARQWFSVYLPRSDPDWRRLNIEGVHVHYITRHQRKLRRGEIKYNEFCLRLHFADETDRKWIDNRLAEIQAKGFPNYFGSQRFGRGLHNLERADQLLRHGLRQAGERSILISAARSWLFNCYLSSQLASGNLSGFGPLYGKSRDPQLGEAELKPIYALWVQGLRRLGARIGERQLVVIPETMSWQFKEEALELKFRLGSGSYATSLLREVFIIQDEAA